MEQENNLTNKEYFDHIALEKINSGAWGLQQVDYLHKNKDEYGLKLEDINLYVLHVYRYTYNLAISDGHIDREEMAYLQNIKKLYNHCNPPQNVAAVMAMKQHINAMTKNFIHNHTQKMNEENIEAQYQNKLKQEAEELYKKPVPKYPRPKLTPYSNFW